jgi:hypothetical protein
MYQVFEGTTGIDVKKVLGVMDLHIRHDGG